MRAFLSSLLDVLRLADIAARSRHLSRTVKERFRVRPCSPDVDSLLLRGGAKGKWRKSEVAEYGEAKRAVTSNGRIFRTIFRPTRAVCVNIATRASNFIALFILPMEAPPRRVEFPIFQCATRNVHVYAHTYASVRACKPRAVHY